MENNKTNQTQNQVQDANNLADDFRNLEAILGEQPQSKGLNLPKNLNSTTGFDGNEILITADDEELPEEDFNNLVGAYDQPKKTTVVPDEDILLVEATLAPQTNSANNGNNSANAANNNSDESDNENEVDAQTLISHGSNINAGNATPTGINNNLSADAMDTNAPSNANNGLGNGSPINNSNLPSGNNAMAVVKPKGKYNQRFVLAAVITVIVLLTAVFHNTSIGKPTPKTSSDEVARALPPPENPRMADPELRSYELGMPDGKLPSSKGAKAEEPLPEVVIPKEVPPAPVPKSEYTPVATPTPKAEVIEEPEDFAIKFRAANKLAADSLIDKEKQNSKQEAKEAASALQGLRIPMQLIEPLRSGIPTNVAAVVIADVKDSLGETLVPKGSRVQIPFLAFEVQGRVTNDPSANSVIVLTNNKKLAVKGMVKGVDGFAGLSGKVRQQSKGNFLARTGRAVGRVGARIVGLQTGGVGGFVIEDTINETVNTSLPFVPSQRVVEVMAGTPFTFNVN